MTARCIRDAAWTGMLLVGVLVLQGVSLHRGFLILEEAGTKRLAAFVAHTLSRAYRAQDDLEQERLLRDLAKTPGVRQAVVLESGVQERLGSDCHVYSLRHEGRVRGVLMLRISETFRKKLMRSRLRGSAVVLGVVWILLVLYLGWLHKEGRRLRLSLEKAKCQLESEAYQRRHAEAQEKTVREQWAGALRMAMRDRSAPTLVLDHCQRVVAANDAALACLSIKDRSDLFEKSWHEVPHLGACGEGLERSLSCPGQAVEVGTPKDGPRLTFYTESGGASSTWIGISVQSD